MMACERRAKKSAYVYDVTFICIKFQKMQSDLQ